MKLSTFVGGISWGSVVLLLWMLILGRLESSWITWFGFWFFVIVGVMSGAISLYDPEAYRKRKRDNKESSE